MAIDPNQNLISTDTSVPNPDPIQTDTGVTATLPNPAYVDNKAFKAAYGLAGTKAEMPQEDIKASMSADREDELRTQVTSQLNAEQDQKKQDAVTTAINNGASNDEVMKMLNTNTYFDPRTVFELNFGNAYTNGVDDYSKQLDTYNPWNVIKNFGDDEAIKAFGTRGVAYHDYILHRLQGTQTKINQDSKDSFWSKYIPDFAAMAFPVANPNPEIKLRGNIPGVNPFDSLLGTNLEDERNHLYDLPFKEGTAAFDKAMDALEAKNPQAAAAFAASMLGQTGAEKLMNNLNTVGTALDAVGVIKLGMLPFKAASVIAAGRKAMLDTYIAKGMNLDQTRANIIAATGNIKDASVENTLDALGKRGSPGYNPTEEALNQLPRFLDAQKANIAKDPGNLIQNQTNLILQGFDALTAASLEKIATMLRPTRVPYQDMPREAIKAVQDSVLERYPGWSNEVNHVSDPYTDPLTGTSFVDIHVGNYGSEEEAINKARFHGESIKLSDDQTANLKVRIADLKQQLKEPPSMEDDVHGLNHYFDTQKQLKDLEEQLTAGTRPTGSSILNKPTTIPANPKTIERINEVKAELKDLRMDEDTAGMNRAYELDKELQLLTASRSSVEQQGLSYYVRLTKSIDEEHPTLLSLAYTPEREASLTPDHGLGDFLNIIRNPDDTMSLEARQNRKAAVYPQSLLNEIAHQEWQYIKQVGGLKGKIFNKTESREFKQALLDGQKDETLNFQTPGRLQDYWLRRFNHEPSFAQQQAYFAMQRLGEYDRILREAMAYKYKAMRGAETHEIHLNDANGERVTTAKFDGVQHNTLPGPNSGRLLVVGDDVGKTSVRDLSILHKNKAEVKDLQEKIKSGEYKLIQPWDTREKPFASLKDAGVANADQTIDYILVKGGQSETTPLSWQQIPRRFGGHQIYDYSHYLKFAVTREETVDGITRIRYQGDKPIVAVPTRRAGQHLADVYNEVMKSYTAGQMERAKALTAKHLPFSWEELVKKIEGGAIDPHQTAHVVPKGMTVRDVDPNLRGLIRDNSRYTDDSRRGLAQNYKVEFAGQRDAPEDFREVYNAGSANDPVFNYRPAEVVDPFISMNRGLGSIIRSTVLDDYKLSAVRSFLEEAKPYMKLQMQAQTEYSPFGAFYSLSRGDFEKSTDAEIVERLMGNKFKIDSLLGTPGILDNFLHRFAQMSHDAIYGASPKLAGKLIPSWLLSKTRDPFGFIRSITFDAYLGMFYPAQLWVQMASFVNVWALRPQYAVQSTAGALLHGYAGINDSREILESLDNIASKLGWKPGEWKEAREVLAKTGFGNVAGEYGPLSTLKFAQPITMGKDTFLNWGRKPFQWGERNVRLGAWYTAFKEFRDSNPSGAITRLDMSKILENADLYYGNMSSASNSVLHTGILSLPTQFFSYTLRLAEIFWSKRIGETVAQRTAVRARVLAANAAIFGVPMAFGVPGLPISDWLRRQMLENGFLGQTAPYSVNDAQQTGKTSDWIEHLLMEGLPATMLTLITGNNYNIGPRMGTSGFDSIRRTLSGDAPFLGMLGASGSLGSTAWKDSEGARQDAWQVFASIINKDTTKIPVTGSDIVDLFRSIQTVGKGDQLITALNGGHYLSRNQSYIKNVQPGNALFMFLTGLSPQEQADAYSRMQGLKDQEDQQKRAGQLVTKEINRAWESAANNDHDQANKYLSRAVGWGILYNLPEDKMAQALAAANAKAGTSLLDNMNYTRLIKNAPKGMENEYLKKYQLMYRQLHQGK